MALRVMPAAWVRTITFCGLSVVYIGVLLGALACPDDVLTVKPPVLLVVLDTVRADRTALAPNGPMTTPFLAELAETSLVFTNAASTGSWTLPAHASLFTGRYPYQHGVHWRAATAHGVSVARYCSPLQPEDVVLAEVLREAGYRTIGVTANYWLTEQMGFSQGFEVWRVPQAPLGSAKKYVVGAQAVDIFLRELDKVRDEPFFAFLNLMDAHAPYQPDPSTSRFSPRFLPYVRKANNQELYDGDIYRSGLSVRVNRDGWLPNALLRNLLISLYDDEILYADHQLRRVLAFLKDRKRLDDTILVVVGDHGESFFSHGLVNHGIGVYEETIHVPLLLRYPGVVSPGRIEERVEIIDVFPTLLKLAGLKGTRQATWMEGSFGIDLTDPAARREGRASLAENYRNEWERTTARPEVLRTTRAVVLDGWKLIEVEDGPGGAELYDLESDPSEQHNLVNEESAREVVGRLQRVLAHLSSGTRAEPVNSVEIGTEERERLRALGYLGTEDSQSP